MYACLMHPEIRQSMPGTCPKCAMALVEESSAKISMAQRAHPAVEYSKLALVFALVALGAFIKTSDAGVIVWMSNFMGFFFLVFGLFKVFSWKEFALTYSTYDIIAKRSMAYAYMYPLIELALAALYLSSYMLFSANIVTIIVLGVSTIGVAQNLLAKNQIQCACLGTIIKLPLSTVTLLEDVLMVAMAAAMLFAR